MTSTEIAIRELFEKGSTAWNRGDIDGYLAGYWDSDDTRWARGSSVIRGRRAIDAAFKARFTSAELMGRIEAPELEIQVLSEKDALVFGQLAHTVGDATQMGLFTVHVRNIGREWFVVSDHFSTDG